MQKMTGPENEQGKSVEAKYGFETYKNSKTSGGWDWMVNQLTTRSTLNFDT